MHKLLKSEDFWTYAVNVYDVPAIKGTCLTLQDSYGADVNMLLLCCWLDQQKITINQKSLNALQSTSVEWQNNTLHPLRVKRRAADKKSSTYRELLQQELTNEQEEQKELIKVLNGFEVCLVPENRPKSKNVKAYGNLQGIPKDALKSLIDALPDPL